MSYMIIKVYSFECDRCGALADDVTPYGAESRKLEYARSQLRLDGWSFRGEDLCPACSAHEGGRGP